MSLLFIVKKKSLAFLLVCSCVHMHVCEHDYWPEVPQESIHLFSSCCPGAQSLRLAVQSPRDPAFSASTALGPQAQAAVMSHTYNHFANVALS